MHDIHWQDTFVVGALWEFDYGVSGDDMKEKSNIMPAPVQL
jgi:hypothetical protein